MRVGKEQLSASPVLEFLDLLLSGILLREVRLCGLHLAADNLKFLAELAEGLFL